MGRRKKQRDMLSSEDNPTITPPKSNVTDETIREFMQGLIMDDIAKTEAAEAMKAAVGKYRSRLKAMKTCGLNTDAVTTFMKLRKQEITTVNRDHRDLARICAVMGMPVEYLLHQGQTVSSQVDAAAIQVGGEQASIGDIADAHAAGEAAGKAGKSASDNPYPDGSPLALHWESKRKEANVALAAETFGGSADEPGPVDPGAIDPQTGAAEGATT